MSVEDGPKAKTPPATVDKFRNRILYAVPFIPLISSLCSVVTEELKGTTGPIAMAKRVLVADDSNLIRKQIRTIIESDAELAVCAEALNGLEAVQKAQESCPDLAIIDFQMPMMDGLKATRKIKRLMPLLPILLFTLSSSPQLEWESKRAGADAVLLKMEGSTGLPAVMHSLLQNR